MFNTINEHVSRIDKLIQMRQAMIQLMKEAEHLSKIEIVQALIELMIMVQELTKQMKAVQLSRMEERGSYIDTTNERYSNFDIQKETATGFNTTIYEIFKCYDR